MSFVTKMKRRNRCDFCANYRGKLFCTNVIVDIVERPERLCDGDLSSRPTFCPLIQVAIQRYDDDIHYVEIKDEQPR